MPRRSTIRRAAKAGTATAASYGVILVSPSPFRCQSSPAMDTVYVLRSLKDPEHYDVGLTTTLDARLRDHNEGKSAHTSKYRPWEVIVTVNFKSQQKAEAFELYLKSGSDRAFCIKHL